MNNIKTPEEIEKLAADASLSIAEVCRRAGVSQSTFSRWKHRKTQLTLGIYQRICAVVQT